MANQLRQDLESKIQMLQNNKPNNDIHIYFDSDGVLANMKGFMDKNHIIYNPDGVRDRTVDVLMWNEIRQFDHFYDRLEPLPGSVELFKALNSKFDCEVLTAIPSPEWGIETAGEDKINWCKRYLGEDTKVNIVYRAEKANYAKSKNDVLVDDLDRNIKEWEAKGGTGILFTDAEKFDFNRLKDLENNKTISKGV